MSEKKDIINLINKNEINKASSIIEKALIEKPDLFEYYNLKAICLLFNKKIEDAISTFDIYLSKFPKDFKSIHYFAARLSLVDLNNQKIPHYFEISLQENNSDFFMNYALYLDNINSLKSEDFYLKSIALNKKNLKAYIGLMAHYNKHQQFKKSIKIANEAINLNIANEIIFFNLAHALMKIKDYEQAIIFFKKVISLNKLNADAYNNLGLIYNRTKQYDKAIDVIQTALNLSKKNQNIFLTNLGLSYFSKSMFLESIKCYRDSLRIKRNEPTTLNLIANYYRATNRFSIAQKYLNKALKINKTSLSRFSSYVYCLAFDEKVKPEKYFKEVLKVRECFAKSLNFINIKRKKNRIGVVSGDLKSHPVAFLTKEVFKQLSKEYEIYHYSNNNFDDDVSRDIKSSSSCWRDISSLNTNEASNLVDQDEIYYLFDLSGHTLLNRLDIFFHRAAPIQISWAGWLASTGIENMDYIILDKNIYFKNLENQFCEKLLILDNVWNTYSKKDLLFNFQKEPPCKKNGYITFGAFHNPSKVNDFMINLWSQILRSNKQNKIYFIGKGYSDSSYVKKFVKKFKINGINIDQLIFSGPKARSEFLNEYNKIDLLLDTFPYGGGSSSFETISMGVPILTLKGNTFLSRCGYSINKSIGFEELVASSAEDYVNIGVNLGVSKISSLYEKLNKLDIPNCILYDSERLAKDLKSKLDNL